MGTILMVMGAPRSVWYSLISAASIIDIISLRANAYLKDWSKRFSKEYIAFLGRILWKYSLSSINMILFLPKWTWRRWLLFLWTTLSWSKVLLRMGFWLYSLITKVTLMENRPIWSFNTTNNTSEAQLFRQRIIWSNQLGYVSQYKNILSKHN